MSDDVIKRVIKQLAGTDSTDNVHLLQCEVNSVDAVQRTCTCNVLGGKYVQVLENVQLMADVEDGLLLVPVIGSTVIVSYSEYMQPYIAMFSEIDQVFLSAGGIIQINDGSYSGLVRVKDLTNKLNNLENKVNDLISNYNTHVHTGVTSGTASSATTTAPVTGALTPTQQSEIENKNVTHGV